MSFYSNARLNNLNEAKTDVAALLHKWNRVESLTKELLITDNPAQTRIPWVAVRHEFGENLSSFIRSPITRDIQAKDVAFAERIKTLGMLWELTKKRLAQADIHLEKYTSVKKDLPFTGSLLGVFGELRATRRYSVELKEFIEDLKWAASLSDDSFVTTLTDMVNYMADNIRRQTLQLRINSLLLSVIIIIVGGLFAIYRTMELARSREQYRRHAAELAKEIEERKKLEQARKETEDKFSQMAENISEVFWMTDPKASKILYVSPAYEKICHRPCDELYKDPGNWTKYIHQDDLKTAKSNWEKQLKGNATYEEFRMILPDGSIRWIANRAYPIKDDKGGIARITGVAEDITERRRAIEEKKRFELRFHQAQKMESLGTLAGGIAHDFNNLLMGIQGRTSLMMLNTDTSHPNFEHLKGIEGYVKSSADLTKQLLGFARGGKYEVKTINLNGLIKNQSLMFSRTKKE
ncbi:MAG TPA: PAS domain-containing protein, partial [Desulfatiglandales bacterium]|nr:PAS domain-containing protein [Desulfatiglandales bacterium]